MSVIYTPNDNAIGLQLASPYATGSGSIVLKTGQGSKFVNFPTCVTLITNASYDTGAGESLTVFTVTGKSTDTLTGVVVASGYTDTAYTTNDYCENRVNALYLTAVIANLGGGGTPGGSSGQIQYNNAGALGGFTMSGDATIVPSTGAITITKTSGTVFGPYAKLADTTQGDIPYMGASSTPAALAPGVLGNALQTGGTAANPAWCPNIILPQTGPAKYAGGLQFKCGACTPVQNTAAATSIFGSPTSPTGTLTIPANALTLGSSLRWLMTGIYGCTGSTPTIGFNILLGGVAILQPQAAVTLSVAQSGSPPFYNTLGFLNVQAIGASALAGGAFSLILVNPIGSSAGTTSYPGGGGGPVGSVSFASNSSVLFDIQVQFSAANASNTFTLQSFQLFLDN